MLSILFSLPLSPSRSPCCSAATAACTPSERVPGSRQPQPGASGAIPLKRNCCLAGGPRPIPACYRLMLLSSRSVYLLLFRFPCAKARSPLIGTTYWPLPPLRFSYDGLTYTEHARLFMLYSSSDFCLSPALLSLSLSPLQLPAFHDCCCCCCCWR